MFKRCHSHGHTPLSPGNHRTRVDSCPTRSAQGAAGEGRGAYAHSEDRAHALARCYAHSLRAEFVGYAGQVERCIARMRHAQVELAEVALGGTAVGTGINAHPQFAARVCQRLSELNGITVGETSNHFQAQSTLDNVVEAGGALNTLAVSLMKVANDIRWLGSGPRAGIGEIDLRAVQPGSSIMPGKVIPLSPSLYVWSARR
ncbi:MAG: hypothetical protein JO202_06970 [Ktedonobacteraceae bacterium]|nr:hypothetical protein [Ktedonobacteraceae bacterium]